MENLIHGVFHPDRYTGTYSLTGNPGLKFCLKQLKAPDPQPDRVHFHKFRQAASGQKAVKAAGQINILVFIYAVGRKLI